MRNLQAQLDDRRVAVETLEDEVERLKSLLDESSTADELERLKEKVS